MKTITRLWAFFAFTLCVLSACSEDKVEPTVALKDIELTNTPAKNSIALRWKPVEGCSWYRISFAKKGETLGNTNNYQDLINNPITYTISSLTPNTAYDIKIEGSDYASGGKLIASKTISVTTIP